MMSDTTTPVETSQSLSEPSFAHEVATDVVTETRKTLLARGPLVAELGVEEDDEDDG